MQKKESLYLIDGSALAYRAFYTFISRPLINSKGENTGAIYGFVASLMKILDEENPDYIAVVFDRIEPTFRHKMYEPYKATRQKMPEDMVSQLGRLREAIEAFNVPILDMAGYEADDIMGTLALQAEKKDIETYLVTGDKDFMQLISPLIKILKPGKSGNEWEIVDFEHVEEKFGVNPDKVTDVLGLTGDKSDNVPGVPGIGEITAIPLIKEFGSIENIYKNIESVSKPGIRNKLIEHKDKALLSKKLVTIETNVPIDTDINRLKVKSKNIEKLIELFTELEFKSLVRKLKEAGITIFDKIESVEEKTDEFKESVTKSITDITIDKHKYYLIKTENELKELYAKLSSSKFFVFDTETTSTDPFKAELVGLAFSLKAGEAFYIPIIDKQTFPKNPETGFIFPSSLFESETDKKDANNTLPNESTSSIGLECSTVLNLLSSVFNNSKIAKCGQNIKYDMLVLANHGIEVNGALFDTMVASYILRPDGRHNLDSLALTHLNYKTITYDELMKNEKDIRNIPVDDIMNYSAEDADITYRLYETIGSILSKENLLKLCEDIEFPLISVLADMELTGVKLNTDFLNGMSKELERILDNIVNDIYNLAGSQFNINSTQQLGKILFEDLKLPPARKTKTGYSTDVGVLEDLRHEHPIIEKLLDYRTLSKLKSTYVDSLSSLINPKTNRVHTSFNQTITATGRLSSSNPNLQNIPIRTEIGREIRKAFVAENDSWMILSADYSQIELRVMAHISGDPGLLEAFNKGEDIHATTASKIFGYEPDEWKSLSKETRQEMRRKAKEVNFGIMYGLGPYGLATRLDIPQSEAKEIINKYHQRFPNVKSYIEETIAKARRDGYVETLMGRRRYLPEIKSRNQTVRSNAERQAINMPIQGTAADMIKLAMISIHREVNKENFSGKKIKKPLKMLLQVHDELVFEIHKDFIEKGKSLIIDKMKSALPLSVPIEVEVGLGNNWYEAH